MPMISNFLFHRVSPVRDRLWDPMDVTLFEKCIRHISDKYEVRRLEDIDSVDLSGKDKLATILFDDGYKDNIDYAADILSKYKCPASFYVVTDCIDRNIPTWTFNLDYSFEHTCHSEIDMTFDFLPESLRVKNLPTAEARLAYVKKFKAGIKELKHEDRLKALNRVFEKFNDLVFPLIMMNWTDLHQLNAAGHYIGSHSVSHAMLGTMDDESAIRKEVANSARSIEKNLGYLPTTISYPVGSYNQKVIDICKEEGYKAGLAVRRTIFNPKNDSLFEIPRIELYNEPWWKMKLRMSNLLEKIKTVTGYQ